MAVEIINPEKQIVAGGTLQAQVLLELREPFEASDLTVSLYGVEDLQYISLVSQSRQSFQVTICEIPTVYKEIEDGRHEAGQFVYPFELSLP